LITESDIVNVDQKRLYQIYESWPEHFRLAAKINCKLDHEADFYDSVVLCGMGGSATSCDILNDVLRYHTNLHSIVLRDQQMPLSVDKNSLAMIFSVSGNTQETVSMLERASERDAEIICITSGGRLKEAAEKNGHKTIIIPDISIPRASLPYLLMPGLNVINQFLPELYRSKASSIHRSLSTISKDIAVSVPDKTNEAKKIANFLLGALAFSFTSPDLISVGNRFKNSLNENAKVHCINESILEASHNEIVPFTFKFRGNISRKVLLLRWIQDRIIVSSRFQKVKHFLRSIDVPFKEIIVNEENLISAIVSSIYLLDRSTIYMAIASAIDPAPTPAIDILKKASLPF
jgi:glucose/mannose-6-phosphate isomerase